MQNLIILTGDLASGKSTLAASLSEHLNIPFFTKDDLKETACDAIGFTNREENRKLSICATDSMIYIFNQLALTKSDLILEANFRHEEMVRINELCMQYAYKPLLICLTGDIHLLYQRFLDRLPHRHKAHTSLNLDYSLDRFASYINQIREEDLVFPTFKIDMSLLDEEEVMSQALDIIHSELGI